MCSRSIAKTAKNCIFSYLSRISIAEGRLYAYHAQLDKEQASVLVAFPVGKPYTIVESRGPSNREVSVTMLAMVNESFRDYSCEQMGD